MWKEVGAVACDGNISAVFSALKVWVRKPNVLDRRLCGAQILAAQELSSKQLNQIRKFVSTNNPFSFQLETFFNNEKGWQAQPLMDFFLKSTEFNTENQCSEHTSESVNILLSSASRNDYQSDNKAKAANSDYEDKNTKESDCVPEIIMRLLLPKLEHQFSVLLEIVLFDPHLQGAFFVPMCEVKSGCKPQVLCDAPYRVHLDASSRKLVVETGQDRGTGINYMRGSLVCSCEWLQDRLLPRLVQWSEQPSVKASPSTLQHVDVAQYNAIYQTLKAKYGPHLVKIWPERTDPQKYVYEDIAIASYMLALWEKERETNHTTDKQSFVDLGCGNGLLVYLLSQEGHKGLGIDVRKRKIWDGYGCPVNLQEQSITPSDDSLFPGWDWLIGNHSDELTPWIPVIAARSGYNCRYFVLPCCPYDFHGKFGDRHQGLSQYASYLQFVEDVGRECGFDVHKDVLRIPSTKRTCFFGATRNYDKADEISADLKRTEFIQKRQPKGKRKLSQDSLEGVNKSCKSVHEQPTSDSSKHFECEQLVGENNDVENNKIAEKGLSACASDTEARTGPINEGNDDSHELNSKQCWIKGFTARESCERVRNCTRISASLRDQVIDQVFKEILNSDSSTLKTSSGKLWHKGGVLPLGKVAAMVPPSTLKQLKSECGGLQTLLRNHHQVFRVQGGNVQLRDWTTDSEESQRPSKKSMKSETSVWWKTKLCWFHDNHPDGCPLEKESCKFAHGQDDKRTVAGDRR